VNADEFVRLLGGCQVRLRAYISSLLFGSGDVDDVLQDVVAILWHKIGDFQPGTNFGAWACQVTRLKVYEHRRLKPRENCWNDEFLDMLAGEAEACADEFADHTTDLDHCLQMALTRSDRILVLRRYQPGCSVKELAEEARVSEVTLRKRLRNALRELEICLSLKRHWT